MIETTGFFLIYQWFAGFLSAHFPAKSYVKNKHLIAVISVKLLQNYYDEKARNCPGLPLFHYAIIVHSQLILDSIVIFYPISNGCLKPEVHVLVGDTVLLADLA